MITGQSINLNCHNVYIVYYPGYSGGKFLINCLALSRHCVLQDKDRINLSVEEKFRVLDHELDIVLGKATADNYVAGTWSDFRMGCDSLFNNKYDPESYPAVVTELTNGERLFFVIAHIPEDLDKLLGIWHNAKVICFNRGFKFVSWRTSPAFAMTLIQGYRSVPPRQEEVLNWSADWFLDRERFMNEIKYLYTDMGLDDFNPALVEWFYNKYMQALTKLKTGNFENDIDLQRQSNY